MNYQIKEYYNREETPKLKNIQSFDNQNQDPNDLKVKNSDQPQDAFFPNDMINNAIQEVQEDNEDNSQPKRKNKKKQDQPPPRNNNYLLDINVLGAEEEERKKEEAERIKREGPKKGGDDDGFQDDDQAMIRSIMESRAINDKSCNRNIKMSVVIF